MRDLAAAASLGLTVLLALGCRPAPAERPNVVVILIDTLRPDYLETYGYPRSTAPFLAELAKRSVVFEQAFSTSSWTVPSVASLFTSTYPHQHGVVQGLMAYREQVEAVEKEHRARITLNRLSKDASTLAERFQTLGYSTFGIAANVNLGPELGFQRGFGKFHFEPGLSARHLHGILETWKEELRRSKPFLAYLHLNDVHSPFEEREPYYESPPSGDAKDVTRNRYVSEIGFVDEYLRKTYDLLGDDKNTVFVFLSDHGEEFWDHGGTFHGATLYRELTQVLMMFTSLSGRFEPRRVQVQTSLVDVLPTLLDLAGGEPDDRFKGRSLRPILESSPEAASLGAALAGRTLYAHLTDRGNSRHRWAVLDRESYLIETESGGRELFLRSDVAQLNPVQDSQPDLALRLEALLDRFKEERGDSTSDAIEVDIDRERLEMLRSLGYVEH